MRNLMRRKEAVRALCRSCLTPPWHISEPAASRKLEQKWLAAITRFKTKKHAHNLIAEEKVRGKIYVLFLLLFVLLTESINNKHLPNISFLWFCFFLFKKRRENILSAWRDPNTGNPYYLTSLLSSHLIYCVSKDLIVSGSEDNKLSWNNYNWSMIRHGHSSQRDLN